MKKLIYLIILFFTFSHTVFASSPKEPLMAPQPTSCISSSFSAVGSQYWKEITLKIKNDCGKTVDFQNATITFLNKIPLNTSFWGEFSPLAYPDGNLQITSQAQGGDIYLATLNLHFPEDTWANKKLPAGNAFSIKFGAPADEHLDGTVQVYLSGVTPPASVGNIKLINNSAKPLNISQDYAIVHINLNGRDISVVELPWSGSQTVTGLSTGTYGILAENLTDSTGKTYQASANPASVQVIADQTVSSTINYTAVAQAAKLSLQLSAKPTELNGYIGQPVVEVIQSGTGTAIPITLNWGASTVVSNLQNGTTYNFMTPAISYNGYECKPTFNPMSLIASNTVPVPNASLGYVCSQVAKSTITLKVTGAPTNLSSLKVNLTPNNGSATVSQTIPLTQGQGTSTVLLTTGTIYNLSADAVPGYTATFSPNPLTASPNLTATITFSTGTPVSINGQLKVCGTKLCNKNGVPVQLRGMGTHGIQWYGLNKCLTQASLDALAYDFKADVIRIALYVQEGGYDSDPVGFTNQVNQLINEATKRGMYALVDWHILDPGDPNANLEKAKRFFTDVANANKGKVNLLYEIANEPNGVSWSAIKTYADKLIPVIRAIDPNTPILIGTPGWSSLGVSDGRTYQDIVNQPVNFPNIMYTFHFYAASHRDEYLSALDQASNVLPIFVTEFGMQTFSGDGANDFTMTDRYMQLFNSKKIGWTNWNFSDDFRSGAIWKTGTCSGGPWTDSNLKPSGVYIKDKIKNRT